MQITFWSPLHGRGATVSCLVTALGFALTYNSRSLLLDAHNSKFDTAAALLGMKKLNDKANYENGIDSLDRLSLISEKIDEQDFKVCTNEVIKNRLDLLMGSNKVSDVYDSSIQKTISKILDNGKEYYDVVFVDANSGLEKAMTEEIIKVSDIVMVVLEQNHKVISDFFENEYKKMSNKKIFIVLGRYNKFSEYSKEFVRRKYKFNGPIFCVPQNTELMDNISDYKVKDFMGKINKVIKNEEDDYFFSEVNEIIESIYEFNRENHNIERSPITFSGGILGKLKNLMS